MTDRLSTGPRPWTANGYADACKRAATAQGLDPLTAAAQARAGELERVGITYSVEQTGGFTMVAARYVGDHVWTVTEDGGGYLACYQTAEGWREGTEPPETAYRFGLSLAEALALAEPDR
jgi:hypothetical protein